MIKRLDVGTIVHLVAGPRGWGVGGVKVFRYEADSIPRWRIKHTPDLMGVGYHLPNGAGVVCMLQGIRRTEIHVHYLYLT